MIENVTTDGGTRLRNIGLVDEGDGNLLREVASDEFANGGIVAMHNRGDMVACKIQALDAVKDGATSRVSILEDPSLVLQGTKEGGGLLLVLFLC